MATPDLDSGDLDAVANGWLVLPDLAEAIDEPLSTIRMRIRDRTLIAVRRGDPPILSVPAEFVHDGALIKGLTGAITVLGDARYSDVEAMRWLLSVDPVLDERPVDLMAAGRHTAVKRRAMALAF